MERPTTPPNPRNAIELVAFVTVLGAIWGGVAAAYATRIGEML